MRLNIVLLDSRTLACGTKDAFYENQGFRYMRLEMRADMTVDITECIISTPATPCHLSAPSQCQVSMMSIKMSLLPFLTASLSPKLHSNRIWGRPLIGLIENKIAF